MAACIFGQYAGVIEIEPSSIDSYQSGELICTGLVNPDTPLIRYRVGDRGKSSNENANAEGPCRYWKVLTAGPTTFCIARRSYLQPCSPCHGRQPARPEAQIIQKSLTRVQVLYVPLEGFNESTIETVRERIYSRMGKVNVSFEEVSQIPRTSNGKFRAVVCELSTRNAHLIIANSTGTSL